jgi:hypothetical protein
LRSQVPDGDLAVIVGKAVRQMRQRLEARRFGQTRSSRKKRSRASTSSRYLAADIRRTVYRRDGGRCRFVDAEGRRCSERHRLEYHHQYPYGLGGGHEADNICLMCRTHNRYLAELDYGKEFMARHQRSTSGNDAAKKRRRADTGCEGDDATFLAIPEQVIANASADGSRVDGRVEGQTIRD